MNHYKPGCLSCDIVTGKISEPGESLYENEFWQIGNSMDAAVWPGFLIIKLKRHCEHVAELTAAEATALGSTLSLAAQAVTRVLDPAKIYVCSFGDGVKHVHFWILPRPQTMRAGMHNVIFNLDLRLFLTKRLRIRRWLTTDAEINSLADQLRAMFTDLESEYAA